MDARSQNLSRAEVLFAELLVAEANPSASRVRELCAAHPELAHDLERLHAELLTIHELLPPRGDPDDARLPELGAFRCLRLLGRGGMGDVWEAEDLTLGRTVAIKLLRDTCSAGAAGDVDVQRFQREAQAAGHVQHPGIVAVHQTGEQDGRRYIVQELVPGGRTLCDEIEELRRLAELPADHARRVARRFETIADALAATHAAGIVHRDVKPRNVLLTPAGEPKVADFGLARLTSDASLSRDGGFLGTYVYASPEQIDGDRRSVDERSDVFSLGATLYENLTLRRAFDGDSVREISRAVLLADPPAPHAVRRRIPRELSLVCMKAMEKRPADRYATMAELRDDLRRFLAHEPVRARPPSAARRAAKWARRHPTAATALGLSLTASVALAILFVRSEDARAATTLAETRTSELNRSLVATAEDLRTEEAVAEEVIAFLLGMFEQASPHVSGDRVPTVRELVDRAALRLAHGEVVDPRVRARVLGMLGSVARSLGDVASSQSMLEESLALWDAQGLGRSADATEVELALVSTLARLGEKESAERRIAALVARLDPDVDPSVDPDVDTSVDPDVDASVDPSVHRHAEFEARFGVRVLMALAGVLNTQGRFEEAEAALDRAEDLSRLLPPPPEVELELRMSQARSALVLGRSDEARVLFEAIVAEHPELLARATPLALDAVNALGMLMIEQGDLEQAERLFQDLVDDAARMLDADHPTVLLYRMNLARVWEAMGRYAEAEALYRELLHLNETQFGPLDIGVLTAWNNVATCLVQQARPAEAEAIFRDLWNKHRGLWGEQHHATLRAQHNLAHTLGQLDRVEEALELQQQVVERTPPGDPNAAGRRAQLAELRAGAAARE